MEIQIGQQVSLRLGTKAIKTGLFMGEFFGDFLGLLHDKQLQLYNKSDIRTLFVDGEIEVEGA
jgi:hypothetical protein